MSTELGKELRKEWPFIFNLNNQKALMNLTDNTFVVEFNDGNKMELQPQSIKVLHHDEEKLFEDAKCFKV